ncbi:MAG: hypothetical protein HQM16_06020 [Deltaproteobacteria bacterium]|nr:hypothetical protein [Deltaproteobacteria bacterium]
MPGDCVCPQCKASNQLYFTGKRVARGVVWLSDNLIPDYQRELFPIASCHRCGFSPRVLSCEVLPRKTYSLPVIEHFIQKYVPVDAEGHSLRQVVGATEGDRPHFSTLHRWLAGLGERVLDRLYQPKPAKIKSDSGRLGSSTLIPTAALFAETEKKLSRSIDELWQKNFCITDWKYKSIKRYDQLLACLKLIFMAFSLFTDSSQPQPLTKWNAWLIDYFHVAAWYFPTGLCGTSIQHHNQHQNDVKDVKHLNPETPYDSRSPPNRLLEI